MRAHKRKKATDFILNIKNHERELEFSEKHSDEHNVSVVRETELRKIREEEQKEIIERSR